MLQAITAAITARASLINTCRFRSLGRGDRVLGDITQFPTKSLTIYACNNIIPLGFFVTYFNKSVLDEKQPGFDAKSEVIGLNPET